MSNTKSKSKVSKKLYAAILVAVLAVVGVAAAANVLTAPEHVTGTPQDKPTPAPTATPSTSPAAQELHLTSNVTDPFYKGDTLHMEAALTVPVAGITVTLYNNGNTITTAQTDAAGVAVFERAPLNPFDYTVSAELP